MKPVLKWVGGKTQILDEVLSQFPSKIQEDYYEPFIGGASVLLAVIPRVEGVVYASDLNQNLIELYKKIQTDPEGLIRELEGLQGDVTEETYYKRRDEYNVRPTPALLVYLNKVGFRGIYREGPNGFNVPYGHMKNPSLMDPDNIRNVSRAIQKVVFTHQSYEKALETSTENDFIYMDPPYVPENATSFTGYTRKEFNHEEFFKYVKALKSKWVMSNSNMKLVRDFFNGYKAVEVSAKRAIHSKDPSVRTTEVIISKH